MRTIQITKLVTIFAVAFSLASLSGPLSSDFHLPTVQLANAVFEPCQTLGSSNSCAQNWYPAGPAMKTLLVTVFSNEVTEYTNLLSANPSIDLTDWQVPASVPIGAGSQLAGAGYYLTTQVPELGYYEIEFHLDNVYWGCNFAFGTSPCGVQIRQGIAHMIDKTIFASSDPNIPAGTGTPIDNPLPTTSSGGLLSPDSCLYDSSFPQPNLANSPCSVGHGDGSSIGGASYHLASATGANGFAWLPAPGSPDLNAAAQHFVNAGLAGGFNAATSVLTGITATQCPACPTFFIRNDNLPRKDLGESLSQEITYLFTGSYALPSAYMQTVEGPITAFPGFQTSKDHVNQNWWFYTAAFNGPTFYDGSLYFGYNSNFVSASCTSPSTATCTPQVIGGGTCSNASVGTESAGNYQYACVPAFDSLSTQLETSPCGPGNGNAPGDPVAGATSNLPTGPGNGNCVGVTPATLSSHSAGIQAEAAFGQAVLTLPVFQLKVQYGYLQCQPPGPCNTNPQSGNSWSRVINHAGFGEVNYFTWLNAWNPNPTQSGTIRQGFKQTTKSVNPYIASTVWDTYIMGQVYDSLYASDPLDPSTVFDWMSYSTQPISTPNYSGGIPGFPTANGGTKATYRFSLPNTLAFQDGSPVTSYDVAFSYLSMVGSGAFLGTGGSSMSGVTIVSPSQVDISVNSVGPFVLQSLTGVPIVSARYWTNAGSTAWGPNGTPGSLIDTCFSGTCQDAQFSLAGATVNCVGACTVGSNSLISLMTITPTKTAAAYDPISQHTFIGSGPFQCGTGTLTTAGSGTCTPGAGNAQNSYTLTAFPKYFRSSVTLAGYLWAGNCAPSSTICTPVAGPAQANHCFNVAITDTSCSHYQQGIGNGYVLAPELSPGVTTADILFNVNWLEPRNWVLNPLLGIGAATPVLYNPYATGSATDPATLTPAPNSSSCATANTFYNC